MVYLWYAYRIDVLNNAANLDNLQIARDCFGSAADNTCLFDEFLEHIHGSSGAWSGYTGINTDLYPDVYNAASDVASSGYDGVTDAGQVLPGQFRPKEGVSFGAVYGAVTDIVQDARKTLGDDAIQDHLDSLGEAIKYTKEARIADQAPKVISALQDVIKDKGYKFSIVTEPKTTVSGVSYTVIDTQATLASDSTASAAAIDTVDRYLTGKFPAYTGTDKTAKKAAKELVSHQAAIDACETYGSKLATATC
jgi:hypothetical protein